MRLRGAGAPPLGSIPHRGDPAPGKLGEDPLDKGGTLESVGLVESRAKGSVPLIHAAPLRDGVKADWFEVVDGHLVVWLTTPIV